MGQGRVGLGIARSDGDGACWIPLEAATVGDGRGSNERSWAPFLAGSFCWEVGPWSAFASCAVGRLASSRGWRGVGDTTRDTAAVGDRCGTQYKVYAHYQRDFVLDNKMC